MNNHDYISSGIIESYVLGLATEEESKEFEKQCKLNPKLVELRNAFELMLEDQVLVGAMQPPKDLFGQMMHKIEEQHALPGNGKIIPFYSENLKQPVRGRLIIRYLAAASFITLLCCGYFLYRLQQQNNSLAQTNKKLLEKYKSSDSTLNNLVNGQLPAGKNMAVVHLTGANAPTQPQANIYWDSASAAVYLVATNLQPLPPNKQYQLWAQIDGKPRSLGVFDAGSGKVILKMNNSKKADAFAITVEPKGGDTVPSTGIQSKRKANEQ